MVADHHSLLGLLLLPLFIISFCPYIAMAQSEEYVPPGPTVYFRPSVAIVIGIFAMMFSLTFLLLMYAKYCHHSGSSSSTAAGVNDGDVFLSPGRAHSAPAAATSGVVKNIIESLPFFRFAALRGSRAGMECAVCLSPYDEAELLRLLPACKHAFHLTCVDQWLEQHSSCPLCRAPVLEFTGDIDLGDLATTPDVLSLFVEREPSCRFDEKKKLEPVQEKGSNDKPPESMEYDKFRHRIVISGAVMKSRWSDLNSIDHISLCDMLRVDSSGRFSVPDLGSKPENPPLKSPGVETVISIKKEMQKKRLLDLRAGHLSSFGKERSTGAGAAEQTASAAISRATRSMSEIVNFARVRGSRDPNYPAGPDDQVRRAWLPIVVRTVRWFTRREDNTRDQQAVATINPDYKTEIDLVTSV